MIKRILIAVAFFVPISAFAQLAVTTGVGPTSNLANPYSSEYATFAITGTNGLSNILTVEVYHAEFDFGTNSTSAWSFVSIVPGNFTNGATGSILLSGLAPAALHFYRVVVLESNTLAWSGVTNFETQAGAPTNNPVASSNLAVEVNSSGVIIKPANFIAANGLLTGNSSNATIWSIGGAPAIATNNAADFTSVGPLQLTAFVAGGTIHFSNTFNLGASFTLSNATVAIANVATSLNAAGSAVLTDLLYAASSATALSNLLLAAQTFSNIGSGVIVIAGSTNGTNLVYSLATANSAKLGISIAGESVVFTPGSGLWFNGESGHNITAPTIQNGGTFLMNSGGSLSFFDPTEGYLLALQFPFGSSSVVFSNALGLNAFNFVGFPGGLQVNGSPILTASAAAPVINFFAGPNDQTAAINSALASNHVKLVFSGPGTVWCNAAPLANAAIGLRDSILAPITNDSIEIEIKNGTWLASTNEVVAPDGGSMAFIVVGNGGNNFYIHSQRSGGLQGPGRHGTNLEWVGISVMSVTNFGFHADGVVISGIEGCSILMSDNIGTPTYTHFATVENCILTNTGNAVLGDGFGVNAEADHLTLRKNFIWDSSWRGIEFNNDIRQDEALVMEGNVVGNCLAEMLTAVTDGAFNTNGWTDADIENNYFYDAFPTNNALSTGIQVFAGPQIPFVRSVWKNNWVIGNGLGGHNPLVFIGNGSSTNCAVNGLYVSGGRVEGVFVSQATLGQSLTLQNITSVGNLGAGIDFQNVTNATLINSTITGNVGTDVLVEASSANVTGYGNTNGVVLGKLGPALTIGTDVSSIISNFTFGVMNDGQMQVYTSSYPVISNLVFNNGFDSSYCGCIITASLQVTTSDMNKQFRFILTNNPALGQGAVMIGAATNISTASHGFNEWDGGGPDTLTHQGDHIFSEYFYLTGSKAWGFTNGWKHVGGNVTSNQTANRIINNQAGGLYLKDTQSPPHYWQSSMSSVGVLTWTDAGTLTP